LFLTSYSKGKIISCGQSRAGVTLPTIKIKCFFILVLAYNLPYNLIIIYGRSISKQGGSPVLSIASGGRINLAGF